MKSFSLAILWVFLVVACAPLKKKSSVVLQDEEPPGEITFENAPLAHPKERFEGYLVQLERIIPTIAAIEDPQQRVSRVRSSGIKTTLRYFQVLLWIYKKQYEVLEPFQEDAKILEDFVSHIIDVEDFLRTARGTPNEPVIQAQLDKLSEDFRNYVVESSWFQAENSYTAQLRTLLDGFDWQGLEEDRNFLLKRISKKMKKQFEEEYDLNAVEEGLHELRRDARRYTYLNQAIGNVIRADLPGECPLLTVAQWDALPEEDRTNIVPNLVPEPVKSETTDYFCHIQRCLLSKLSRISSSFVSLKAEGARYVARGEPVPQSIFDRAANHYWDQQKSLVYMHLWSQIKQCQTPGEPDIEEEEGEGGGLGGAQNLEQSR